jgi:23S rRNA (cytosine1962-C5)-methyltransferase
MDAVEFLKDAAARGERYDLIVIDPPTYSKSKMARGDFDVQRDHGAFLNLALSVLSKEGTILFSTNYRRFKLRPQELKTRNIRDITARTIPQDFRDEKIHQCWLIRH